MTIVGFETRPATGDRFADVATILAPKRAGAQGCWCLSRRLSPTDNKALSSSQERGQRLEALCNSGNAPGVLAYQDDDVVGWAAIALREQLHGFSPRRFPIDPDGNVWVVSCFRVRAGHGKKGVARALLDGAVDYARACGAAAVEAYPIETGGDRIDRTQASAGILSVFTDAGFEITGDTGYQVSGHRQVIVRRTL